MQRYRMIIMAAVFLAGLILPHTGVAQDQQSGFAFIDLDSVFTNYNKTKLAEAQLKEQAEDVKDSRRGLIDEIKTAREEYKGLKTQSNSAALNEAARVEKLSEAETALLRIKALEKNLGKLEESARRKFEDQSRRARKRLVEEINRVLKTYAKDNDLLAVIDTSGESLNGVPTVVYYKPELDITEQIIELINE